MKALFSVKISHAICDILYCYISKLQVNSGVINYDMQLFRNSCKRYGNDSLLEEIFLSVSVQSLLSLNADNDF